MEGVVIDDTFYCRQCEWKGTVADMTEVPVEADQQRLLARRWHLHCQGNVPGCDGINVVETTS